MKFHPVADLFPLMSDDEFRSFCADIKVSGLREDIWTHEGMIIDGRNRFNACQATGVEPRFRQWSGGGSLVAFVVSLNLQRRHLNESQRAMIAAKIANVDGAGRPRENASIEANISQSDAAEMLNVSRASVQRADRVLKKGIEGLAQKVDAGEMSVHLASEVAELSKGKQMRIIKRGRDAAKRKLNEIKVKVLEKAVKRGSECMLCGPVPDDTDRNFLAAIQLIGVRFPNRRRYLTDVIEEISQEQLSDETRENYGKVLASIDAGYQEKADIQHATRIEKTELDSTLAVMMDYGMISAVRQGGKTCVARGAAKVLYIRKEVHEHEPPPEEDDDDLEDMATGLTFPVIALRLAG